MLRPECGPILLWQEHNVSEYICARPSHVVLSTAYNMLTKQVICRMQTVMITVALAFSTINWPLAHCNIAIVIIQYAKSLLYSISLQRLGCCAHVECYLCGKILPHRYGSGQIIWHAFTHAHVISVICWFRVRQIGKTLPILDQNQWKGSSTSTIMCYFHIVPIGKVAQLAEEVRWSSLLFQDGSAPKLWFFPTSGPRAVRHGTFDFRSKVTKIKRAMDSNGLINFDGTFQGSTLVGATEVAQLHASLPRGVLTCTPGLGLPIAVLQDQGAEQIQKQQWLTADGLWLLMITD